VQESKDNTNRLLAEVRQWGHLRHEYPTLKGGHVTLFSHNGAAPDLTGALDQFLDQAQPGDYVAIMAYLPENPTTKEALKALRVRLRDRLKLATTVGFGPRFLHSTGQLHKGGPNTGLFLQITADDPEDMAIPHQPYTFGTFKQAQAQGDLQALREHDRRVLRLDLGDNIAQGLAELIKVVAYGLAKTIG
jgi:transaldolase / glucose-6-phosphate isomerase